MISLIIGHYPANQNLEDKLDRCLHSLSGYDELVLVVNDGIGFAKTFNTGLKYAKGDYLLVVSNDTYLTEGNLLDLCIPNTVTSPVVNKNDQPFWGCFFCIPRNIYEQVGGFDEQFEVGYFEDDDLIMRLRALNIPMQSVPSVEVRTEGGQTIHLMDRESAYQANSEKFFKKWGVANANSAS